MILDGPGAMGGGSQIVNGVLTTCWGCDSNGNFYFGAGGTGIPLASLHVTRGAMATPSATRQFQVTDAADTARTASTEYNTIFSQSNLIRTWATGALALQRENRFDGGAIAFVGASVVAQAATIGIGTAPTAGTNATLADAYGLLTASGVRSGFGGALVGNLNGLPVGLAAISFATDANTTITASQAANPILNCTSVGSLTGTRNLILPTNPLAGAIYWVINGTTGAQSIQIIGQSGTGITIATAKRAMVFFDGTNMQRLTGDQ